MIDEYSLSSLSDKLSKLEPLETKSDHQSIDKLRIQLSESQFLCMKVASTIKSLSVICSKREQHAYEMLKRSEEYIKARVEEKKIIRRKYVGDVGDDIKYLNMMQDILDKRCTTAQSLLKSSGNNKPEF